MTVVLSSPRLKLERAGEHLKALHAEMSVYAERQPHRLTTERDSDGWTVVSIEVVRPLPESVAAIAGDAVHCLRCALDHIVYAVSTGSNKRSGYWPICTTEDDYLRPRGKPPCERPSMRDEGLRYVPDNIKAIIDQTQPYLGTDRSKTHVFAVVSRLDNADKHRAVQPTVGVLEAPGTVQATQAPEPEEERELTTEWLGLGEPLRMGEKTKILRWRTEPPSEHVYVKYRPKFGVVFGEGGTLEHLVAAREVIYKLVSEIETAVV